MDNAKKARKRNLPPKPPIKKTSPSLEREREREREKTRMEGEGKGEAA